MTTFRLLQVPAESTPDIGDRPTHPDTPTASMSGAERRALRNSEELPNVGPFVAGPKWQLRSDKMLHRARSIENPRTIAKR